MSDIMHTPTAPFIDGEPREATPVVEAFPDENEIVYKLHKGAMIQIDANTQPLLATAEESFQRLGIRAAVLAEISLGKDYSLLLFDRGQESQGIATPLSDFGGKTVSDRYFLATKAFIITASIKAGFRQALLIHNTRKNRENGTAGTEIKSGIVEFCAGSSVTLGRSEDYSYGGQLDVADMPITVSRKHAAVSVGPTNVLHIGDCVSENLTSVRVAAQQLPYEEVRAQGIIVDEEVE